MIELKKKLIAVLNESKLPLEQIFFVIKDLYRDIDEAEAQYELQKAQGSAKQAAAQEVENDNSIIS